jgi:type II secretory pathway pseudopilin PulG
MSLIETCIAVVLVATLTTMAIPSLLQSRDDYLLKSAAADVATQMHQARVRAISRNTDCRLRVTTPVTYAVECQEPVWAVMQSVVLARGFTISATARPEFHRLGNVAPAATLTVKNRAGRARKVVVNTAGRIRIEY